MVARSWCNDLLLLGSQEMAFIDSSNKLNVKVLTQAGLVLTSGAAPVTQLLSRFTSDRLLPPHSLMWIPCVDADTLSLAWLHSLNRHQAYPNSWLVGILDEDELTRCQEGAAPWATGFVSCYTLALLRGPPCHCALITFSTQNTASPWANFTLSAFHLPPHKVSPLLMTPICHHPAKFCFFVGKSVIWLFVC